MLKKVSFGFLSFGVFIALAASNAHSVDLYQDSTIGGEEVKAGTYKVEMKDNLAVLKHGKDSVQVPAREETTAKKFDTNQVLYSNNQVREIDFGGTHTKIVFGGSNPTGSGL